jgi:predicted esterase
MTEQFRIKAPMKAPMKALVLAIFGLLINGGCDGAGGAGTAGSSGGTTAPSGGSGGALGGRGAGGGANAGDAGAGTGGAASTGAAGHTGAAGSGATAGVTGGAGASPSGGTTGGGSGGTGGTSGLAGQTGGVGGRAGTGGQAGRAAGGGGGGSGVGGTSAGGASGAGGQPNGGRTISFGTLLDPQAVMSGAQQLAASLSTPGSAQWRAKGDQHRTYRFADANTNAPYRLYVPTNWDGQSKLPLVMFLHGAGSDENTYVDQNNKQLVTLAQQHGYLLVAPLGDQGAYGNFLRLSAPFGKPEEAVKLIAQITPDSERTNELSEKDVINVLELVLAEYPIDRAAMFLTGHSMGSGGTWYIGGKYASYWKGLAPMSGPFVQESGYPWTNLRPIYLLVTEGTQAPSLEGSHALRDWLNRNGFMAEYTEVNADHGGMVKLVLPGVFDFFDRSRSH